MPHTLNLEKAKWRVLDQCHTRCNLAEYEGHLDIDAQLLKELVVIANELHGLVVGLGPIEK